jgi:DNA-binding Lrp family transcriptional regulator
MDKPNPDFPKLTKNDERVLKMIIEEAKVHDSDIAKGIGITPQAVAKIRNKLEKAGIIKGYMPIIDFKKIGINIIVIMQLTVSEGVWERYSDAQLSERIRHIPNIIAAYRLRDRNITHIIVFGFKDNAHKDRYLTRIQTQFSKEVKIEEIFTLDVDNIITENPVGLLYQVINKKDILFDEFFLKKSNHNS